jgi:hypothetical protein
MIEIGGKEKLEALVSGVRLQILFYRGGREQVCSNNVHCWEVELVSSVFIKGGTLFRNI